jgi:hypothetical protein
MTAQPNAGDAPPGNIGTSLEGLFLQHFLIALTKLQESMRDGADEEKRWEWFNLQSMYVLKLIPDRDQQEEILKLIDAKEAEYKKNRTYTGEYTAGYVARLEVVTEVIMYLSNSLDLVNNDIIGSMTHRATAAAYKKETTGTEDAGAKG